MGKTCLLNRQAVIVGVVQSYCRLVAMALNVPIDACSAQVRLVEKRLDVTVAVRKDVTQKRELPEDLVQGTAHECWAQMRAPMSQALAGLDHTWWDYHGPKSETKSSETRDDGQGSFEH